MRVVTKAMFNVIGTVFVSLGVLGIFVPLLPTTVFLLLAAACYVRGSEKLYNWLLNHKYLGPYLRNFREKRGMPWKAKIITLIVLWVSLLISIFRMEQPILRGVLVLVGLGVTTLILCIKTMRQAE